MDFWKVPLFSYCATFNPCINDFQRLQRLWSLIILFFAVEYKDYFRPVSWKIEANTSSYIEIGVEQKRCLTFSRNFTLLKFLKILQVCRYVDCQEENTSPPGICICERRKSTNQAAIRGLLPHEIFSLNASRCRTLKYEVLWYLQHPTHGHLMRCFYRSTVHLTTWLLQTVLWCRCIF